MFEFAFTVSLELEGSSKLMIGMFHSSYGAITLFFWLDLVYNFFTAFYNDEGEVRGSNPPSPLPYPTLTRSLRSPLPSSNSTTTRSR